VKGRRFVEHPCWDARSSVEDRSTEHHDLRRWVEDAAHREAVESVGRSNSGGDREAAVWVDRKH
jgi:hypothetical protein